ncbi:MlrC C-terminal domain-containing protein [Paenibacillus sanfengchensis]|uniref:MlrC C-terminal domain-containing protein n=1 Tax=Paenibacillus TaxID=44249 RepID=UPI003A5C0E1C
MDLTLVLKRLLELGWRETLVAVIVDAAAWEMCSKAGEGGRVGLGLGRLDPTSSSGDSQLAVDAEVVTLGTVCGKAYAVVRSSGLPYI